MSTNENLPPNVIKQLSKELKNLNESPPEGITVVLNDDDFSAIFADIDGPGGTPYENGVFRMKLILSHDFPQSPPKGYFVTKIFHPNIAANGEICVNTLKKDWNPSLESALNEQAGKMLLEDYDQYARHARLYTGIHAMRPKPKAKKGAISESAGAALNVDQTSAAPSVHGDKAAFPNNIPPLHPSKASAAPKPLGAQKKEGAAAALAKAQADKKLDARKKSLKRL